MDDDGGAVGVDVFGQGPSGPGHEHIGVLLVLVGPGAVGQLTVVAGLAPEGGL